MAELDIGFIPHNDLHPDDLDLTEQHKNLIQNNKFSDAAALLDNSNYRKGFRASLFNALEAKILELQVFLLNKYAAEPDELYSVKEPSEDEMAGKTYWVKPY